MTINIVIMTLKSHVGTAPLSHQSLVQPIKTLMRRTAMMMTRMAKVTPMVMRTTAMASKIDIPGPIQFAF